MKCPKCSYPMERVCHEDHCIARCTHCIGLWFPALAHKELKQIKGSEVLDTGEEELGRSWNRVEDIDCAVCGTRMLKTADEYQTHIWYEACPRGCGTFFDAGEFRDYVRDEIMDFFRSMAPPRGQEEK